MAPLLAAVGFHFHPHDLRRTGTTLMAEAGVPREHLSAVLNHMDRGPRATRVYDRYDRDAEKRVALDTLARVVEHLLTEQPQPAVVPFSRRPR